MTLRNDLEDFDQFLRGAETNGKTIEISKVRKEIKLILDNNPPLLDGLLSKLG